MKTIIVGIDGSHAAITAALWGVDEAISRAVPLRLVSVIKPTHPSPDDYDRDLAHGSTPGGSGTSSQVATSGDTACTSVRGIFRNSASRAAHRTATCAAGESSIPTIIPRDELPDDIAVLLSLADRPLGRCGLSLPHDGNGGGGFCSGGVCH